MKVVRNILFCGFVMVVASVLADITRSSLVTSIDLAVGSRSAAKVEHIAYCPSWASSTAGAVAEVAVDGVVVSSSTASGVYDWTPTSDGTYTLTHTVKVGGEQVGDTLTATFVVSGLDPIPDLGENPTDAQVATAISGSVDTRLSQYVTNAVEYVAYRSWATNVQQLAGGLAGTKAVHDSPHAWLSYALDSSVLVTNAPVQGEMRIASFEKNSTTGKFDFLVAVDGITVGAKALPEKLATLFSVEGCGTVDGEYLSSNVSFEFGPPSEGKILISALPNDEDATQFFIKAKMNP